MQIAVIIRDFRIETNTRLQIEEDASLAEAESAASFVRSMAVFFATTLLSLEIVMTLADATADAPPSVQRTLGLVYQNGKLCGQHL